jgi:cobaltochelatase CobS
MNTARVVMPATTSRMYLPFDQSYTTRNQPTMNHETINVTVGNTETAIPADPSAFDMKKLMSPQELAFMDIMLTGMNTYMNTHLEMAMAPIVSEISQRVQSLTEKLSTSTPLSVNFKDKLVDIDIRHMRLETLLQVMSTKQPALIVGPAGTGKTHAAWQASQAFDLPFYSISVGAQTSKTDLVGYLSPMGRYMTTAFRDAYENGGVFLMDEMDAGNPNVLIIVNQALAASMAPFPDGMVKKHDDFIFIATANTFGLGANRQYVGRNQLDAATLDRFVTIEWPVDEKLEAMLVHGYEHGERWHKVVIKVRRHVDETGIRAVVSPRMTVRGAMLLELGIDIREVIEMSMPRSDQDSWAQMLEIATKEWGK